MPRYYGLIKTDKGVFVKLEDFIIDSSNCAVMMLKING